MIRTLLAAKTQKSTYRPILAVLVAALLASGPLFAQDAAAGDAGAAGAGAVDESVSAPERANYLERHHAIKRVNQIKGRTLADIKRLKVLVANFGGDVEGAQADFEKIREMYHSAEKERYRRRFVESAKLHENTRQMISDLYKKFTEKFKNQTADLLAECAEIMVDAEFAVSGEPGQSARSSTARIFHSSQKLNIAYQQTAMAEDMIRTDRFDEAITHLRLAKSFAINVLRSLEDSSQKQDEIEKKYKVDLLDARGLSSATGTESTP
ncbi:MAG: hypothetical protein NXI24_18550 [bacterium]|nr:hypothetical protein [bacterium]